MDPSGADISSLCVTSTTLMLEPNIHVMRGGVGALGEHLGQEMQPHDWIRNPIHQEWGSSLPPSPCEVTGKGQARTWALSRHHICLNPDLRLPRLHSRDKEGLLLNPPCLKCGDITAFQTH